MVIDLNKSNMTLAKAISVAKENDIIYLEKGKVYTEKIEVATPKLTLIGDASIIQYNDCHSTIHPVTKKKVGTTGSSTVRVLASANGFKAVGVTFVNSHQRNPQAQNQAVAFKAECSNVILENCRFISNQDTLYLDFGTDNLVKNCYIEGDVDFIFGSADVLFLDCKIHAKPYTKSYYTAPDTFINRTYGFVFVNCVFTTESEETYLGRRWYPSGALETVLPKVSFIDCSFTGDITPQMLQMHEGDSLEGVFNLKNCAFSGKIINSYDSSFLYEEFVNKIK